ncbi:MAG TPA: radical SAM protein [Candidatus Hydrogenedentes bacterium]|nr:radical SAM protein [Candidatus Hydrogenedentota bacterium]
MSTKGRIAFRHYAQKEGHPDWDTLQAEAKRLADEILPKIHKDSDDTLKDRCADTWRAARSIATACNNYRINRRRWKQDNHALRPLYFIWTMLYPCNFRCTYCDDHRGNHYYDLKDASTSFEDRVRVLRTMRTGTSAVYFCGGEPTLVKDLPEFTDAAYKLGYKPLMINTNGSLIHQNLQRPEWHRWLRQMDIIIISVDGLHLPRLRKLWGVEKVEQVFINLLLLRELRRHVRFKLCVNTVISPETIDMAGDVLDFANDLGDVWFVPVPVHYHGQDQQGFSFERDMIHREDYQELTQRILDRKRQGYPIIGSERILKMLLNVEPYTCLPTLRPHVDPDGRIAWPCRGSKNTSPVYVNLLDYDTVDDCWAAAHAQKSASHFHGPGPGQCGDMCAWMQNYTTARYHHVLTDPFHAGLISEIREFAFRS